MNKLIRLVFILIFTTFLAACGGGGGSGSGSGGGSGDGGGDGNKTFAIDHTVPADGSTTQDRDAPIEIHFTTAVDMGSVQTSVLLLDASDNDLAFETSLSDDGRVVYITPLKRLQRNADYRLELDAGILPQGSGSGLSETTLEFTTSSERQARPAIALVPMTDCTGNPTGVPWLELLDDGSAYVALPKRKLDGDCTNYDEPELATVYAEKRAPEPGLLSLTSGAQVGETALQPRRDPATGNILFLATELNSNYSLYAARVVNNTTRLVGEKQTLVDIGSESSAGVAPNMQAYVLPYQGKFHVFYRDGRTSCGGTSCDLVREYVLGADGTVEGSGTAFGAAWPFAGNGRIQIWTAASTPEHIVMAYDQYLDANGRYFMLRGPDYTATFDPAWPIWGNQQAYTHIDPTADLGILLYVTEGGGPFRVFTIKLSTGEVEISPTGFGTGSMTRILPSSARRGVASLLDTARKKLWILWSEAEHDTTTVSAGKAPYRLRLTAYDYANEEWSDNWMIQEGSQPYEMTSGERNSTDNTALFMDDDGTLLLIHTDQAGDGGGELVLQRFNPVDHSVTPVAELFSTCSGPRVVHFDAARNDAGDIAVAIEAKYAQYHCTSDVHEDGEYVLVRYD